MSEKKELPQGIQNIVGALGRLQLAYYGDVPTITLDKVTYCPKTNDYEIIVMGEGSAARQVCDWVFEQTRLRNIFGIAVDKSCSYPAPNDPYDDHESENIHFYFKPEDAALVVPAAQKQIELLKKERRLREIENDPNDGKSTYSEPNFFTQCFGY